MCAFSRMITFLMWNTTSEMLSSLYPTQHLHLCCVHLVLRTFSDRPALPTICHCGIIAVLKSLFFNTFLSNMTPDISCPLFHPALILFVTFSRIIILLVQTHHTHCINNYPVHRIGYVIYYIKLQFSLCLSVCLYPPLFFDTTVGPQPYLAHIFG